MTTKWSATFLDSLRQMGDPLADGVIERLAKERDTSAVSCLMRDLVRNQGDPSPELPPFVLDYLASAHLPEGSRKPSDADLAAAERLFALYGPEILLVLGTYGLPMSYAASRGVQVLYRSGYLQHRAMHRVWETTQFVVDVMSKGGLGPAGRGVRTAQKVRLMHAAIRHLVQNDPRQAWDTQELGVPINQEDLAGTLMTFSFLTIHGLRHLGIDIRPEEAEAYLGTWRAVSAVLGLDPAVIPADMQDAESLTRAIAARQLAPSNEGRALAAALEQGLEGLLPPESEGFITSAMRFFLEKEPLSGLNLAEMLAVPAADWTTHLLKLVGRLAELGGLVAGHHALAGAALRELRMSFVDLLLKVHLDGRRPPFRIPPDLTDLWTQGPSDGGAS